MDLKQFVKARPRGTQSQLAQQIGAKTPDISMWVRGLRPVPVHRAAAIERATQGAVTRQELRPNDWHLIWPELAASDPAPKKEKEAA